ncbi:MAG TPA: protein kinase [Pyrinomonadaceae bacterium]|nr:protein kinase [Pyrinomonadaceae bacterium]
MTLEAGERIGRYEIQALLGTGGMGEVYRAFDTELKRPVALKFLPADIASDPKRMRRFEQEALAASAVNHPNILTVYDIGQTSDGRRFFATELVDGVTLREHLKTRRLKLGEVFDVVIQVASALVEAHAAGVVHRDIKPENIMLRRDGYVKVLDFGVAKVSGRPSGAVDTQADTRALLMTEAGAVMGTVSYMSPEQASGAEVDARTDIWSLGVVLYEMLTGHLPFRGKSASHTIVSILDDEPESLAAYMAEAPESLQEIVSDALTKDREARFQTAKQMLAKLNRIKRRLDAGGSLDHTVSPDTSSLSSGDGATVSGGGTTARTLGATQRTTLRSGEVNTLHGVTTGAGFADERRGGGRGKLLVIGLLASFLAVVALSFGLYRSGWWGRGGGGARFAPLGSMKLSKVPASGATVWAAISPDGKYAARVVWEAGRSSLRLRQLATTNEREIVPPDGSINFAGAPAFSHDGGYVYYVTGRKGQAFRELYRVSLLGGDPQKLVFDVDSGVTLSPDGKRLAFRRHLPRTNEDTLVVTNEDGTNEQTLATYKLPQRIDAPAWSPDGALIAYTLAGTDAEGYYYNIDAVNVADRSVKKVSAARWRSMGSLAWLSDGSGLVTNAKDRASMPGTPMQLWHVAYPGGEAQKITNDVNNYVGVSLTADSRTILAKQGWDTANIWVAPEGEDARARQITSTGTNGARNISWLPDGRIVYDSDASGNVDVWVVNADGTGARQLTFDPSSDTSPVASPDGRFIVFRSNRAVGWGLWRMNADGSNARELLSNVDGGDFLQVSPDSAWLYFSARDRANGKHAYWRLSIEGGEPVKIQEEKIGYVRLSPDGKRFFSLHQESEPNAPLKLYLFPAEGGEPLQVLDVPRETLDARDWSPDGQGLDYVATDEGVGNLWRLPLAGGKPRQLTEWKSDFVYRFAWSRDGKQLAVSRGTATTDLVLIKDFR